jgi:hypothetical protein
MKNVVIRRVGGAQAEQARELGLTKVSAATARQLFSADVPFVVVGNKVNASHFFKNWHLAMVVDPKKYKEEAGKTFDQFLNNYMFYLEPELGSQAAFFVEDKYMLPDAP